MDIVWTKSLLKLFIFYLWIVQTDNINIEFLQFFVFSIEGALFQNIFLRHTHIHVTEAIAPPISLKANNTHHPLPGFRTNIFQSHQICILY